ncbi:MAG: zinc ribbon domain-containing protein [Bacilli bacterium]|nr:zinc ribbon domain-containing protein [Bacilli bacterium]
MFCSNCGAKLENDEKFCPSCGTENQSNEKNFTAPKPFETNSVDESKNFQYQKSSFKGKQMSTGTSGSISFGNKEKKKKSFLGRILKLVIIVAVVIFLITWIFGDSAPVYDIAFSNEIDVDYNPINPTKDFLIMDQDIYVTYSTRDLEIGTTVYAKWYFKDSNDEWYLFSTQQFDTLYEEQVGFFMQSDTNGWDIGDYEVRFEVDGEVIATGSFNVK